MIFQTKIPKRFFFNFFKSKQLQKQEYFVKTNELELIHKNLLTDTLEYR